MSKLHTRYVYIFDNRVERIILLHMPMKMTTSVDFIDKRDCCHHENCLKTFVIWFLFFTAPICILLCQKKLPKSVVSLYLKKNIFLMINIIVAVKIDRVTWLPNLDLYDLKLCFYVIMNKKYMFPFYPRIFLKRD